MVRALLILFSVSSWAVAGGVEGKVTFAGSAPAASTFPVDRDPVCEKVFPGGVATDAPVVVGADGGLANVFVTLTGVPAAAVPPAPKTPVVLDQKDCRFLPRVVGVRAGQPVRVGNDDATLHNVRAESVANPEFNVGLAPGKSVERTFARAERMVRLHCHVHHWMTAWVGVVDHPYFAVTGADGRFRLAGVPAGRYGVEVWHETLGTRQGTVTVDGDRPAVVDFRYGAAAGRAR